MYSFRFFSLSLPGYSAFLYDYLAASNSVISSPEFKGAALHTTFVWKQWTNKNWEDLTDLCRFFEVFVSSALPFILNQCSDRSMEVKLPALLGNYVLWISMCVGINIRMKYIIYNAYIYIYSCQYALCKCTMHILIHSFIIHLFHLCLIYNTLYYISYFLFILFPIIR